MTAAEILARLEGLGTASYKRVIMNHGAVEPVFGVKIEELKKIQKVVKVNHTLALELYDSGVYDAMYLAGLIADDAKMSRQELEHWVTTARSPGIAEYTVPWVASQGRFGEELALAWIESGDALVASAGWSTLACLVALRRDEELDLPMLRTLLERVAQTIHDQPNRVRYTMNSFVIAVGAAVASLTETALATGKAMGVVTVDMGGTACKVPSVPDYIAKVAARGSIGKKKKTVKC
jgi:3-methyladenine DNA glycosylase AlkD